MTNRCKVKMFDLIIYLISYFIATWPSSMIVEKILGRYQVDKEGLKSAGKTIGILERTLILTFIFLDQFLSITIILTAKSIARFESLKKRDFAEYYLIGTLTSVLLTVIIGTVTLWIKELFW